MIRKVLIVYILIVSLILLREIDTVLAQQPEMPPRPIEIHTIRNLNFGKVISGYGTVEISNDGVRSTTGDVTTFGGIYHTAIFEIEANPGTVVRLGINYGSDFTLDNTSGPGDISGSLTDANVEGQQVPHNQTFTMPPGKTAVEAEMGATLQIDGNISGNYSGNFMLEIVYE